jgi:hypothetical protein
MAVAVVNDWRLTAGRPGLAEGGDQQEARFVGEDDVGTQPRNVFLPSASPPASSASPAPHRVRGLVDPASGGSSRALA